MLMRHFPGINHDNIRSLYLSEVNALLALLAEEQKRG
jgi:hypothetical protein